MGLFIAVPVGVEPEAGAPAALCVVQAGQVRVPPNRQVRQPHVDLI
jgi:hypothetical protein